MLAPWCNLAIPEILNDLEDLGPGRERAIVQPFILVDGLHKFQYFTRNFPLLGRTALGLGVSALPARWIRCARSRTAYPHGAMFGELGMPVYAAELVRGLDDPSVLVAMAAARGLARRDHPQHADAVMSRLHRFMHWRPNFLAAMMSSMGPEAAPAIRRTYADPKRDSGVRVVAAMALNQLHDARSAEIAAQIVKEDKDREVVAASLRLLAQVGRPEDLGLVRARLGAQDPVVRGAAAEALGHLGSPIDATKLQDLAMHDDSRWVAISAARSLRDLGGVKSLRELAASPHQRASLALQVLSETGG